MSEAEDFKAAREAKAGVVSRAGRSGGSADVVRRLVDAAVYRETHHTEPESSTEDSEASGGGSGREEQDPHRAGGQR